MFIRLLYIWSWYNYLYILRLLRFNALACFDADYIAGLSLPSEKWKEILDEANQKTRKLEEDYEQTCVERKVKIHNKIELHIDHCQQKYM